MADLFTEVDSLRETLRESLEMADKRQEDISRQDVLTRIENVIQTIVITVSKDEAPVLRVTKRSSWANVRFQKSVGLVLKADASVTALRCDCPSSATKFALILKLLSVIYKLVQSDSYATKRDIYYNDPQLFGTQRTLDSIVDDVSCLLKAVPVSSNVNGIRNIVSSAKFVLIVEKDATFQRLLDDDFCTRLSPCIIITGKGMPDVNSRLMVRKLWDALHIPVFALVDADPHGIEIMCVYKYGSLSMAFEAHSLTVPSVLWLGLLPSDIQRYRVPKETIIPFSQADEKKINSLRNRTYITCQPAWEREVEMMQRLKQKAEIQSLASIAPHFLTRVYLPNKLRYGGWI
ncbi:meiotic recombination protein SPO11 isoform X6 [Megalobrama amblycephala]|uniref:meiotic recombination protein SPO11 isoform X6 n=1 Tax=Megalobrama amblycephala TaxID=75352 RepID=UPI0020145425|nr:meiotic recombination protein SPO11 isoform X6 [Megalobrama amblycephala]